MLKNWDTKTIMYYFEKRQNNNCIYVKNKEEWLLAEKNGLIPVSISDFSILKVYEDGESFEDFLMWLPENIYVSMGRDTVILAFPLDKLNIALQEFENKKGSKG